MRTWAIGNNIIFLTEFVCAQAGQPAYCCTRVQCDNCLHIGEVWWKLIVQVSRFDCVSGLSVYPVERR